MKEIFVDLDGVLVDFDYGIVSVVDRFINDKKFIDTLNSTEQEYAIAIHKILNEEKETGVRHVLKNKDYKNVIRKFIHNDPTWWESLPWLDEGKKLWDYIKQFNPMILTSSFGATNATPGKTKWIIEHLGNVKYKIIDNKEDLATPNTILIDDRSQITSKFAEKGGLTILFVNAKQTIDELNKILSIEESNKTTYTMDLNEAQSFLKEKMSGRVLNFTDFMFECQMNEADETGYGEQPFFFAKNGDTGNYFFKVQDGQEDVALVISIGKFAKFIQPTEQKLDYSVLSLVKLTTDELDQAVVDNGKYKPNTETLVATEGLLNKLLQHLALVVDDYLQKNPSVSKFYDEMQAVLQAPDYDNKFAVSLSQWPGGNEAWKLQTMEKGKLNIITK